jgi:uncharacterized repeat protein (TIGR01451 family)
LCAFLIFTPRLGNRRSSVNWNYHALAGGPVVHSKQAGQGAKNQSWAVKATLLAIVVGAAASMAFHFGSTFGSTAGTIAAGLPSAATRDLPATAPTDNRPASQPVSASSPSFPMFFEPNVGQTDGRVKFLARGSGYGLFLTADDAVLSLQHLTVKGQPAKSNVVRMHLEGASSSARVHGAEPLPGKSNYFIGNNPSKWHRDVPQFARVEYQRVYPGIDLVYYGNQQQLEYDFRVAPGADPNQIALTFQGASAHIDSGDLVLSTADGDVRFHAPHIYQPTQPKNTASADQSSATVEGGFRQLSDNKIGFTIGAYDRSRELVIDPVLSYSTYFGLGGESLASVAIDFSDNIYLACSTTSADFPVTTGAIQTNLGGSGAQNILIAVLNPLAGAGSAQLLFATYLGGSGTDSLGQIAVDPGQVSFPIPGIASSGINIYVAGKTTSPDFPTTAANAFQSKATFTGIQTHGFLSAISATGTSTGNVFALKYSTYLAGNAGNLSTTENDAVTGVAVDLFFDAYVTGTTTSTDVLTGFPSTTNAFQICPWQTAQSGGTPCPVTSGPMQFFASEINTAGSGPQSMLYSTYFGGGYSADPANAATGGGIAVDNISNNPHSNVNMYFTGTTNMWGGGVQIPNNAASFPLINAWQSCLNESGAIGTGTTGCNAPGTNTDAFVVKLNPNRVGATPTYSTFLGGAGNDTGNAVAADTLGNSYVTGGTFSTDWSCTNSCVFAPSPYGASSGTQNAYIAKVTDEEGGIFPLVFFAYIGGTQNADTGNSTGNAIFVDSVQSAHIAGTTTSSNLNVLNAYQANYGGASDAFVALLSSTPPNGSTGDYVTYLGGSALDQGTGIAVDVNGSAYVAGVTQSSDFPRANPYQGALSGHQNAFVSQLGAKSSLVVTAASGSPSPSPLPAGTQGTFTFNIMNNGPDAASNVLFTANVPTAGVQTTPTAEVLSSGSGSCTSGLNGTIVCNVGSLAVGASGQVAVFVTPTIPQVQPTIGVSGYASANGGPNTQAVPQNVSITDFTITATNLTPNVTAGDLAVIQVNLIPNASLGYNATVTMSETFSPAMVTNPTPTFTINPLVLAGTSAQQTVLNIQTVPRPINSGSLFLHRAFYAMWLPLGGLSLAGLGIGAGRKRRRWLMGMMLVVLAGLILLQPACSSGSSPATSGGGTQPGLYQITIVASPGVGAAHQTVTSLEVR